MNGEKRYTRHVYFEGPAGEVITIRLVYDYRKSGGLDGCCISDDLNRGSLVNYTSTTLYLYPLQTITQMYENDAHTFLIREKKEVYLPCYARLSFCLRGEDTDDFPNRILPPLPSLRSSTLLPSELYHDAIFGPLAPDAY